MADAIDDLHLTDDLPREVALEADLTVGGHRPGEFTVCVVKEPVDGAVVAVALGQLAAAL